MQTFPKSKPILSGVANNYFHLVFALALAFVVCVCACNCNGNCCCRWGGRTPDPCSLTPLGALELSECSCSVARSSSSSSTGKKVYESVMSSTSLQLRSFSICVQPTGHTSTKGKNEHTLDRAPRMHLWLAFLPLDQCRRTRACRLFPSLSIVAHRSSCARPPHWPGRSAYEAH